MSNSHSARPPTAALQPSPQVEVTQLDDAVLFYLRQCVVPSTRASYASAQCQFRSFCQANIIGKSIPSEGGYTLPLVAHLGQQSIKYRSIKYYLAGIRFAQIHLDLGDPFKFKAMPRLEYVLTGIKQVQARSGAPPKPHLPIKPELLELLKAEWLKAPPIIILGS